MTAEFIVNHLWQSSCFTLLASVLAFMLRGNSPKVRYWVWLSASLKFLVPFAFLVSLGSVIPQPARHTDPAPVFSNTLIQVAEPFSLAPQSAANAPAQTHWGVTALAFLWAAGLIVIVFIRCRSWLRVQAMLRAGSPVELPIAVPAIIAPSAQEPGIVGFLKPVLVLPEDLLDRLNPKQLEALLAHELSHVRRRDNFFAALHMGVEAIFWFHPLVWWIGSHMLEERELACDEEVLRLGCQPTDYARGILTVCELYAEAPLPCVSGITGADIKKRLRLILAGRIPPELSGGKRLILAAIGLAALSAPFVIGVLTAPAVRAQSAAKASPRDATAPPQSASPAFEVTSVKPLSPKPSGFQGVQPACKGGHFVAITPVFITMEWAYDLRTAEQDAEFREKLPQWAQSISGSYELEATTPQQVTEQECRVLTQKLFEDRFHFKYHWDTVTGRVYEMVVARGGFKMPPADPNDLASNLNITINGVQAQGPPAEFPVWQGTTMDDMASRLSANPDRIPVIDKTGIQGKYKLKLRYSGGIGLNDPFADPDMITAVEQQLGLKLQEARGPVAHFVVDSIEKPDPN